MVWGGVRAARNRCWTGLPLTRLPTALLHRTTAIPPPRPLRSIQPPCHYRFTSPSPLQYRIEYKDGFDGAPGPIICSYIPKEVLPLQSETYWEKRVLLKHQSLHGMPADRAKGLFLAYLRRWPVYVMSVFDCEQHMRTQWPSFVRFAVAYDGIHVFKSQTQQELLYLPFRAVMLWKGRLEDSMLEIVYLDEATQSKHTLELRTSAVHETIDALENHTQTILWERRAAKAAHSRAIEL